MRVIKNKQYEICKDCGAIIFYKTPRTKVKIDLVRNVIKKITFIKCPECSNEIVIHTVVSSVLEVYDVFPHKK